MRQEVASAAAHQGLGASRRGLAVPVLLEPVTLPHSRITSLMPLPAVDLIP